MPHPGSSANRTSCWISCLPPSSAGCALPAMTIWTGRSGSSSSAVSRSGSRSIRVSRLYDGTRRAKPIVSTSGSSTVVDPAELGLAGAALQPRRRAAAGARRRPAGRAAAPRTAQISAVGDARRRRPSRGVASASSATISGAGELDAPRGATQVGACTPLVIELIGTSALVEARPQPGEHLRG